jgi:outer membrane biogenesis lipoprotein LolB
MHMQQVMEVVQGKKWKRTAESAERLLAATTTAQ